MLDAQRFYSSKLPQPFARKANVMWRFDFWKLFGIYEFIGTMLSTPFSSMCVYIDCHLTDIYNSYSLLWGSPHQFHQAFGYILRLDLLDLLRVQLHIVVYYG